MKRIFILAVIMAMVMGFSLQAYAGLTNLGTDSLGNRLIYDSDLNITWYDYTKSYDTWQNQMNWASALTVNFGGTIFDDWRLPTTVDGPYVFGYDGTTTAGYNITSSEMGHLFYTELGNKGYCDTSGNCPQTGWGLTNTGDFQNLQPGLYWSGTEYTALTNFAWHFGSNFGHQYFSGKDSNGVYALAVRPGQVGGSFDYYCDGDNDGYFSSTLSGTCQGTGCVPVGCQTDARDDCNDNNPAINPGASDTNCNGVDENCNGIADDGYVPNQSTCGIGVCASSGQLVCQNGQTVNTCTAGQPTGNDDNCNGIDDNCNGTSDENYLPPSTTCGVGACASTGLLTCVNGSTIDTCTPGQPQYEVCDNIDNNCNGSVDENYVFGGFQQPINADGSSIFKAGSTIPVKIILTDCSGQSISTATVTIAVYKISNAILGTEDELVVDSSGNANTGNLFRYDATAGQYIFNLSTKGYTKGTYKVYAKPDNGQSYSVAFSLK